MCKGQSQKVEISFGLCQKPSLILGPTQRQLRAVVARAERRGISCLVRDTGGTAVLDGPWMLTTQVVVPNEVEQSALARADLAQVFGAAHVAALQSINVRAASYPSDQCAAATCLVLLCRYFSQRSSDRRAKKNSRNLFSAWPYPQLFGFRRIDKPGELVFTMRTV